VEPVSEDLAPVEPVSEPQPPAESESEPPAHEEAPPAELIHEVVPPVEAVKELVPETGPITLPASETTTPVAAVAEQAKEVDLTAGGQTDEGGSLAASTAQQGAAPSDGSVSLVVSAEAAAPALTVVGASTSKQQERARSATVRIALLAPVRLTAAQRAAALSCQLSGLAGSATGECAAGPPGAEGSPSSAVSVIAGASTTGSGGSPGGGYGGSSGGSRSVIPPPGPAPSGAFGSSSAGGSGGAFSGFFTLAGLLLLAGPRAMRRLRLSCRPWLTASFVLIPERPG